MQRIHITGVFFLSLIWANPGLEAQETSGNPIIRHERSADPSAHVWKDGKVWIYASHDQDDAEDYSTMDGYHAYSSSDLVNWTDHGEILHSRDLSWANPNGGWMFAPTAAYKNGTYYFYFPHLSNRWRWETGVATSKNPEGPYTDIGKPMEGPDDIDPCCFMDDDGTAYLLWGGGGKGPWIARLKDNMIELDEEPRLINYGYNNFGEGPYMHKRDSIYYFSYTCHTCQPYQGYYAMGDNPYGPFTYQGELNLSPPGAQDHHSMIEYHGQWYYFYHVGNHDGGSLFRRNVCIDSLFYLPDGRMEEVRQSKVGVGKDPIGSAEGALVPGRLEAEAWFRQEGTESKEGEGGSTWVEDLGNGDVLMYVLDILGAENYQVNLRSTVLMEGGRMELLVDGIPVDTLHPSSGEDTLKSTLFLEKGRHTLELLFHQDGPDPFMELDWLEFDGSISYHPIDAFTSPGGRIIPEGRVYVAQGDSVLFRFQRDLGYALDSLAVNGIRVELSEPYVIRDVQKAGQIEAWFSPCEGTAMEGWYSVNGSAWVQDTLIRLREGQGLQMKVEFPGSGQCSWKAPDGRVSWGSEFSLEELRVQHQGRYVVTLVNGDACESRFDMYLEVEALELDVYQAEAWSSMQGVQTERCGDLGAGEHVGFINAGDWCSYEIEVAEGGVYGFIARVATASQGGNIKVMQGDEELARIRVDPAHSNGWQDWYTTDTVELYLAQGKQEITLQFTGSTQYMFNLNWFDLAWLGPQALGLRDAQNMAPSLLLTWQQAGMLDISYVLDRDSGVDLFVADLQGRKITSLERAGNKPRGRYSIRWAANRSGARPLSPGLYLVVLTLDHGRLVRKFVL